MPVFTVHFTLTHCHGSTTRGAVDVKAEDALGAWNIVSAMFDDDKCVSTVEITDVQQAN